MSKFKFISKKEKEKLNLFKCKESLVNGSIINNSSIEIESDKRLTLEGCIGVLDYRNDYIKLKLKKKSLIICGNSLNVSVYENEIITILGTITSLEFC